MTLTLSLTDIMDLTRTMPHLPQINKAYLLIVLDLGFATVEQALENTELTLDSFEEIESLEVSMVVKLLQNLRKYSTSPNWPTVLGDHLGAASHGPVGYATLSAPSIGKALTTFVIWFYIRCETYTGEIQKHTEYVEIIINDTTNDPFFEEIFFEALMRAFEVLIRQLSGKAPKGKTKLYLKTQATNKQRLMRENYDSELIFGADTNRLIIPNDIWFHPSRLYDRDSYEFNLRKCQQLSEARLLESRIDLQVQQIIRKHFEKMTVSTTAQIPPPTQVEICSSLHITERTLIRKLKDCNSSYKMILETERLKLAKRLLLEVRYTVYTVAEILGYKDTANFCRAFKRWLGKTPTEYRRSTNN